jgi:hypothetical protein
VCVELNSVGTYYYGWKTSLDEAASTKFGHQNATTASSSKPVIFGASRPKPTRASIKGVNAGQSSFVDKSKTDESGNVTDNSLQLISKEKGFLRPRLSNKAVAVYVEYENVMYGWYQPLDVREKGGGMADLGVKTVTGTVKAAFGINNIMKAGSFIGKPPRARKMVDSTGDTDTVSSFYSSSVQSLPEGWY